MNNLCASVATIMSRILIIEDELPMRRGLEDCLSAEGYRVFSAADGESGLQRALAEQPDLILLDIMMPKLDGFAVAAELRRLGRITPILMLTAKAGSNPVGPAKLYLNDLLLQKEVI